MALAFWDLVFWILTISRYKSILIMFNLSSRQDLQPSKKYSETIDLEIPSEKLKRKLPRHISCLESKNYRQSNNLNRPIQLRTSCLTNLATHKTESINLAVDILKYQLSDRASKEKHLENVRRNLQHRLEVAKAKKNSQLVSILQEEFKQLETSSS